LAEEKARGGLRTTAKIAKDGGGGAAVIPGTPDVDDNEADVNIDAFAYAEAGDAGVGSAAEPVALFCPSPSKKNSGLLQSAI